ncbi:MAG: lytic transglycosylase domain-containing protein [Thermodesulfobacteriota bacterium]
MLLSLAKRYSLILNAILSVLLLYSINTRFLEAKEKNPGSSSIHGDDVINRLGSVKSSPSRKSYDVIVKSNVFKRGKSVQSGKDSLLVDFSTTKLTLTLLGTVNGQRSSIAIIKNPTTGEIGSYQPGQSIDLINTEQVKLVEVSKCMVMIERNDRHERINCNNGYVSEAPKHALITPLARYKIITIPAKQKKELYISKSKYEDEIQISSEKYGVDPDLVKAVIKVESNFNPNAISSKNAMGIMQLVLETAKDYKVDDPFDPEENIDGGVRVLRDLMGYFNNNLKLTLAAYNAGKGAVIRYGFRIPPYIETINYVERVLGHYNLLKLDRYNGVR